MIAVYIILAILLLLIVFFLQRAGILIEYSENGLKAVVKLGPFKVMTFPKEEEEEKKEKKPKKKPEAEIKPKEKKGGRFSEFKSYWEIIREASSRLNRKIRVDDLTVYFAAGGEDPVAVAMAYGGVTAAMGIAIPILEQSLNIKNRDFETSFSYELKEPYIYVRAKISAAVWELIYTGVPLVSMYMKSKETRSGKEEK